MSPEQSAAVERLREALAAADAIEPMGNMFTHEQRLEHMNCQMMAGLNVMNAAAPHVLRHLLAALDEAQQDAAKWRNIGAPVAPEHEEELQRLSDEAVRRHHQDMADAARYRWLRKRLCAASEQSVSGRWRPALVVKIGRSYFDSIFKPRRDDDEQAQSLDAAIDAARAGDAA